jgi:phospholipid N-methyltransferase
MTFCFFAAIFFVSNVGAIEDDGSSYRRSFSRSFSFFFRSLPRFLRSFPHFIRHPYQAGGPPSLGFLAEEIIDYVGRIHLQGDEEVFRVLEVGAGNGVFTVEIVRILETLGIDYEFDVIEVDENDSKELEKEFRANDRVHIHRCWFQEFDPGYQYSVIVSGLPHHSIGYDEGVDVLRVILDKYVELLERDGILSFFEYAGFPTLRKLLFNFTPELGREYLRACKLLDDFKERFISEAVVVKCNAPPARVWHLHRFVSGDSQESGREEVGS